MADAPPSHFAKSESLQRNHKTEDSLTSIICRDRIEALSVLKTKMSMHGDNKVTCRSFPICIGPSGEQEEVIAMLHGKHGY